MSALFATGEEPQDGVLQSSAPTFCCNLVPEAAVLLAVACCTVACGTAVACNYNSFNHEVYNPLNFSSIITLTSHVLA
jgi:hypothetical protein